jgi:hypothetical protein
MLDARQSFKAGFLAKCAEDGLTPAEAAARAAGARRLVEKRAFWSELANAGVLGAEGLLLAPPAVGAIGGHALARLTDVDVSGPDDVKKEELADEYLRNAEQLRLAAAGRRHREARRGGGRVTH